MVRRAVLSAVLFGASCVFFWSSTYAAGAGQQGGYPAAPAQGKAQASPAPAQDKSAQDKATAQAYGAGDGAPRTDDAARRANADVIRKTYSFPFGADRISAPGNGAIEGNEFIQAEAFPDAAYCGHCHQEAHHEWRQSLHSNSFRTPFYRTSVNILLRTKGIEFARHCDSCHNPVAVLSGGLDKRATGDRGFDQDGLTCMVCHSIQKVDTKLGNGSYTLGVPAVLVDAEGKRIPGMVPDSEILKHLDRHSKAVMQDIYKTPQMCSACHKANLPVMLNDYKWIRAFTAFDEWQQSKFSQMNPLTFYTTDFTSCQGCHMKREAITYPDPGAKKGELASHRWLAGNTAVPFYYGFDEQLKRTIGFLQSGNYINVDIFGLKREGSEAMIAPLGMRAFTVQPKDRLTAYVVVQNKNIGHSLIPEVRDLYEAWMQFTVTDAAGHDVYRSGFLKPDGTLDQGAHSFTNRPVDATGNFVDNHKVWTIHSVAYDNSVQAGRSTLVRYVFDVPAEMKGPLTMRAAVEYRHLRQSYLNNVLGKEHEAYPVVELTAKTRTLVMGENAPVAAQAGDNEEWMRWNNLGISYIDEQQYGEAQEAFEHVTALRPDYKDGYVNLGVNAIEWEKYAEARAPLEKALALKPNDARALYYLALVERRQRHSEAEIADLTEVVRQFPQSRDARRELGISYYQQHKVEDAMAQFKALQAIDPDDVAAHYNLAILYRRVGMKKEAAEQAAQYAMKRIDPGAPTYSLEYLRKHPEISNESAVWHVHEESQHTGLALAGQR